MSKATLKLIGFALLALAALFVVNHTLGAIPFTPQWSAKRAEAKADRLEGQVDTLERTAESQAEIGQAVETYHTREVVIRETAARATTENQQADDATTPLSPERAARLRAHDRLLCNHSGLCGPADPAGGSPEAVPDFDPAG